jgi:hypothetical protein
MAIIKRNIVAGGNQAKISGGVWQRRHGISGMALARHRWRSRQHQQRQAAASAAAKTVAAWRNNMAVARNISGVMVITKAQRKMASSGI